MVLIQVSKSILLLNWCSIALSPQIVSVTSIVCPHLGKCQRSAVISRMHSAFEREYQRLLPIALTLLWLSVSQRLAWFWADAMPFTNSMIFHAVSISSLCWDKMPLLVLKYTRLGVFFFFIKCTGHYLNLFYWRYYFSQNTNSLLNGSEAALYGNML